MQDNQLIQGDCRTVLKTIPSSIVDGCMIIDFPYPSQERFRATGTTTRLKVSKGSSNTWYDTITIDDILPIATELFRIAANNTHCYVFSDSKMLPIFIHLFTKAGFTYPTPPEYEHGNIIIFDHGEESNIIIWDKVSKGMGYHWRNQIEFIIMFEKGEQQKPTKLHALPHAEEDSKLYTLSLSKTHPAIHHDNQECNEGKPALLRSFMWWWR